MDAKKGWLVCKTVKTVLASECPVSSFNLHQCNFSNNKSCVPETSRGCSHWSHWLRDISNLLTQYPVIDVWVRGRACCRNFFILANCCIKCEFKNSVKERRKDPATNQSSSSGVSDGPRVRAVDGVYNTYRPWKIKIPKCILVPAEC